MTSLRDSRSPAVPSRSPFRIRDSQLSRTQRDTMGRWSFSSELGSLWNMMKPIETYHQDTFATQNESMFSSSSLLTQLLVSQAILDSNDYQILSFDKLEMLKKELNEINDSILHNTKSLELENRIRNISKSLENVNLKNSRHSVLYLQNQRQNNENKIKQMSTLLENLKERQVEIKKALLQHTAATLNKGIQSIELTTIQQRLNQPQDNRLTLLQSELDLIAKKVDHICVHKFNMNISSSTVEKLLQLEKQLQINQGDQNQLTHVNHLGSSKNHLNQQELYKIQQLLAIEQQKDSYYSKMVDIELLTTKLLSQTTFFSQRQKALQMETLVFKTESIELQIWHKKRERDQAYQNKPAQTHPGSLQSQYQGQLEQQAKKYETELNQQAILIQRQTRMCDQLQTDCHRLESQKANLDKLIQDKSKILDEKDNKITRLNYEIRAQKQIAQGADRYDPRFYEQEKRRLNQNFQERESRWTAHTHQMEDKFDELLEGFDRMTNAAMEFDTDRMRYDRKIDELNKHVSHLEIELIEEKIKRIGFSHGESPTTQLLRKEFRQLVADIKKAHQIRMEQEAEEIRRLQIQLEEMHNTNHTNAAYKYQQSMATQTD